MEVAAATEAEVDNNQVMVINLVVEVEEVDLHMVVIEVAEEVEIEAAEEVVAEEETQMPLFSSETWPTHALIEI
jgi:hypothetical protein